MLQYARNLMDRNPDMVAWSMCGIPTEQAGFMLLVHTKSTMKEGCTSEIMQTGLGPISYHLVRYLQWLLATTEQHLSLFQPPPLRP